MNEKLVFKLLDNVSNERMRNIVALRFGLQGGRPMTLEQIGKKYKITRERVRQIERAAFFDLQKPAVIKVLKPMFSAIDGFLNKEGKLVREERLLSSLAGNRGAILFALNLGQPYQKFIESNNFHSLWTNSQNALSQADGLLVKIINDLKKNKNLLNFNDIFAYAKECGANLSKRALYSHIDASKHIGENSFGQYGLIKWSEISPRGAKDKAYLILKQEKRPLHFTKVADLINQAGLGKNPAQPQTVHNELIKDPRFVLVGRGIYALSQWGYQTGTIRDIVAQALKNNQPLGKEEILKKVLAKRVVKPNTVMINLQNKEWFKKNNEGKYILVKS